jgi:hypothetical protein
MVTEHSLSVGAAVLVMVQLLGAVGEHPTLGAVDIASGDAIAASMAWTGMVTSKKTLPVVKKVILIVMISNNCYIKHNNSL